MKKLLLSLGALSAVVAPVATVVACGSTDSKDPVAPKTAKLGHNIISFHAKGFKVDTSWTTASGASQSRNGIFSEVDLSKATLEEKKVFLNANFPKTPVNGVEQLAGLDFWTDTLVKDYTFATTPVNNIFTVDDTKNPASWILGDADKTLAHHNDAEWKKQGATTEELDTFKEFVAKEATA